MEFQIKIPLVKQPHNQIDYNSKVLLLGSCFVENIGDKFEYFKFQNTINPFGILFHPVAIENVINRAINKAYFTEEDVFFQNERWHCFDAHSDLSSSSKEKLLNSLNKAIDSMNQQIIDSTHIVITLGTAWAYRFIETDAVVANCHKVPQKKFLKELLSVDDIQASLSNSIALLKSENPDVNILFTVSPVRHLKDGFVENTRSKAHLISAVQDIVEPRKGLYYFSSYEIMMDELRDYRFYAEDMVHPSALAINHIWNCFKSVWVNSESYQTMENVEEVQKGMAHKPFNPDSEQHQKFLLSIQEKQTQLQKEFPHILFK